MGVGGLQPPMGENGGAVEANGTYVGRLKGALRWPAVLGINDTERAHELTKGIVGKRLTCRRPDAKHLPS